MLLLAKSSSLQNVFVSEIYITLYYIAAGRLWRIDIGIGESSPDCPPYLTPTQCRPNRKSHPQILRSIICPSSSRMAKSRQSEGSIQKAEARRTSRNSRPSSVGGYEHRPYRRISTVRRSSPTVVRKSAGPPTPSSFWHEGEEDSMHAEQSTDKSWTAYYENINNWPLQRGEYSISYTARLYSAIVLSCR